MPSVSTDSARTGGRSSWWQRAAWLCLAAALGWLPAASEAQNQAHTVVTRQVAFARGTSAAQLSGKADHAMSYVYTLAVRKGQTMRVDVTSPGNAVNFSVVAPQAGTLPEGFGVTHWENTLPESGRYQLVLVMNDKHRRRVPYRLQVSVH